MGVIQTNPTIDRVVPKVTVDNTVIRPVTKLFNAMVSKYVFMLLRFRVELLFQTCILGSCSISQTSNQSYY